jgi:hypothetical protein
MFKRIDHVEIVPVQSPDHRWPTAAIISETRRSAWRTSTPKARPKPGRCLQRTTHSCDLRHLHKPYARQITGPRAGKGQTRCTGSLGARLRDRAKPDDNARYLAQWQAEVRVVMEKSAHRHTWIASVTRILHYCEAAGLFDSNESLCPVATAPGQYDSDYARAIYARRRPEEWIGGRPRVILLRTLVQSNETDRADCHVMVRRRHVNAAALNARAVSSVLGRKGAGSGKHVR